MLYRFQVAFAFSQLNAIRLLNIYPQLIDYLDKDVEGNFILVCRQVDLGLLNTECDMEYLNDRFPPSMLQMAHTIVMQSSDADHSVYPALVEGKVLKYKTNVQNAFAWFVTRIRVENVAFYTGHFKRNRIGLNDIPLD